MRAEEANPRYDKYSVNSVKMDNLETTRESPARMIFERKYKTPVQTVNIKTIKAIRFTGSVLPVSQEIIIAADNIVRKVKRILTHSPGV